MELKEYLRARGWTQEWFADRLNITQAAVSRYCRGERPQANVLSAIIRETNGAVTANDFLAREPAPPKRNRQNQPRPVTP
jgi:predicted transcriptional regulator